MPPLAPGHPKGRRRLTIQFPEAALIVRSPARSLQARRSDAALCLVNGSAFPLVLTRRDATAKLNGSPNLDDAREGGQRRGIIGEGAQFPGEHGDLNLGRQPIAQKRPAISCMVTAVICLWDPEA